MENSQYAYFEELPVMAEFYINGNKAKKVSTRTAEYPAYKRRFYFQKRELCVVGLHSRLGKEYHK